MKISHWDADNYEKSNGKSPFLEFLNGLFANEKVMVDNDIERLENYGPTLGMPYIENLGDNVYTLRTRVGKVQIRSFFFFVGQKIIFTNGIRGKSKKIPNNAIKKAIRYRKEYIKNNQG